MDVLAHHDGVIDDDAERHEEAEHRDHVDTHADERQEQHPPDERDHHPHHHPEGEPDLEEQREDEEHDEHRHHGVLEQQREAVVVVFRRAAIDADFDSGRQGGREIVENGAHGVGDLEGRLLADAVDLDLHRRFLIELAMEADLFEGVLDARDVGQRDDGPRLRGHDRNLRELLFPLLALLETQQDLTGMGLDVAGGHVLARRLDQLGDVRECQAVLAQAIGGNLDVGDVFERARDLDLRDRGVVEQLIAEALGVLAQGPVVDVAEDADLHDLPLTRLQRDLRVVGVLGERPDAAHGLIDVLVGDVALRARDELDRDRPGPLARRGDDLLDPLNAPDRVLDRQQDARLDFGGRCARVSDGDFHHVERELGLDLLLDVDRGPETADDEQKHEQVRRDGVARHPGDGPPLDVRTVSHSSSRLS